MTDVVSTRLPPCEDHVPVVFESPQVGVVAGLQLLLQLLVAGLLDVLQVQLLLVQQRTVVSRPPAFKKARRTVVPTQNENAVGHFCMLYYQCSNMLFAARFVDELCFRRWAFRRSPLSSQQILAATAAKPLF